MIGLALLLAGQAATATQTIAPDAFRRQVSVSKLCFLEGEQHGEAGWLYVRPGENLPNIALKRSGSEAPIFRDGLVTSAVFVTEGNVTRSTVSIAGKSDDRDAVLELHTVRSGEAPAVFTLLLRPADGKSHNFSCRDTLPPPPSGLPK